MFFNFGLIKLLKSDKPAFKILMAALLVRLLFFFVGAHYYFNRENIFIDFDTFAWADCLHNLVEHHEYRISNDNFEYNWFGRMPGYSFFMLPFYLLSKLLLIATGHTSPGFKDITELMYPLVAFFQTLLDVGATWLFYKITHILFKNTKTALFSAFLYAFYPFIIVWNPVCYSEEPSVFFALLGCFYLLKENQFTNVFKGAFALGLAMLIRPQIAILTLVLPLMFLLSYPNYKTIILKGIVYAAGLVLSFGWWPARNYFLHNKLIVTQDLRAFDNWNEDVLAFMQYIYTVKAEWDPQFSEIIHHQNFSFNDISPLSPVDSALLAKTVHMASNCGEGFSEWRGYWKTSLTFDKNTQPCTQEIKNGFDTLRARQIRNNPFKVYVTLPLINLQKAFFKSSLSKKSEAGLLSRILFLYRTILILIGLAGVFTLIKSKNENKAGKLFALTVLSFFTILYLYLCAGTSPQCRNIEMRYLLQADIFLLIPAAWIINSFTSRINLVQKKSNS